MNFDFNYLIEKYSEYFMSTEIVNGKLEFSKLKSNLTPITTLESENILIFEKVRIGQNLYNTDFKDKGIELLVLALVNKWTEIYKNNLRNPNEFFSDYLSVKDKMELFSAIGAIEQYKTFLSKIDSYDVRMDLTYPWAQYLD